jgi:hypothetical protein
MYRGWRVLGRQKYRQQESFVPEPSISEVEVANGKLKCIGHQVLIMFQLN